MATLGNYSPPTPADASNTSVADRTKGGDKQVVEDVRNSRAARSAPPPLLPLDAAATKYEERLNAWWNTLASLAGIEDVAELGTGVLAASTTVAEERSEAMCRCVDRIVEEENGGDDGPDGGKADEGDDGSRDDFEPGIKLPTDLQYRVDCLSLRANVALESISPSSSTEADAAAAASLELWSEAMSLIPSERFFLHSSSSSYTLLGAADALHRRGRLGLALSSVRLAMFVPGTIGTPYAHYLTGLIKLELGDEDGATTELGRALYLLDGEEGNLFDRMHGVYYNSDDKNKAEREMIRKAVELARKGMAMLMEEEARYFSSS